MSDLIKKFSEEVVDEMLTLRLNGTFVPDAAIEQASDLNEICDYDHMDINECATLIISLSQL